MAPDEPSLPSREQLASRSPHWALYALAFIVPLIGWVAISDCGSLQPCGLRLPHPVGANGAARSAALPVTGWPSTQRLLPGMHIGAASINALIPRHGRHGCARRRAATCALPRSDI